MPSTVKKASRPARAARPRSRPPHEKLAITMPHDLAEAARREVAEGRATSVSAFVSEAVQRRLENDSFQAILDDIFRDNPMTDQEREWADSILRG